MTKKQNLEEAYQKFLDKPLPEVENTTPQLEIERNAFKSMIARPPKEKK